jgi:HTH-type transcriptional regulator/antitoxin HipB
MYPVDTPGQLRTILRSLRQSRGLTQAQLGRMLGVSQKRIARIEAAPEVTAFDQIARMVSAMGGRLVVEEASPAAGVNAQAGPNTPAW